MSGQYDKKCVVAQQDRGYHCKSWSIHNTFIYTFCANAKFFHIDIYVCIYMLT